MKWNTPKYTESRFGFEITMYIGITKKAYVPTTANVRRTTHSAMNSLSKASIGLLTALLLGPGSSAMADQDNRGKNIGEWLLSGFDRSNHSDSSAVSRLKKSNVHDLQMKWSYSIPTIPLTAPGTTGIGSNPCDDERFAFGASNAVSVDRQGRVYFPTWDGRILVLDSKHLSSTINPDGTASPNLLLSMDLFADPKYILASDIPGEIVTHSRAFPTLIGNSVYAGNYGIYSAKTVCGPKTWAQKALHTSNPDNPAYKSAGAVLYKLNRRTGALIWKTVVDSNPQAAIPATGGTPVYGTSLGDVLIVPFGASNISGSLGTWPVSPDTTLATDPFGGHCCDGRGGIAAIRMSDGKIMWKTYDMPKQTFPTLQQVIAAGGIDAWTGGNPWGGGNLPYSKKLNMLYAGTSEGYSAPFAASQCELQRLNNGGGPIDNSCLHYIQGSGFSTTATYKDNVVEARTPYRVNSPTLPFTDTIFGVDAATGKIKWAQPVGGFDIWNLSCFGSAFGTVNQAYFCPSYLIPFSPIPLQTAYKDRDAATTPVLIENMKMADGTTHDVIIGSGKSMTVYAFDARTGEPVWPAPVSIGPGGINGGGFVWGLATDGKRIYGSSGVTSNITLSDLSAAGNPKRIVKDGSCLPTGFDPSNGFKWMGGMYAAIDIARGKIAWQRCAIGLKGTPNRPLTTLKPVADCISGAAAVNSPNDTCSAGGINAPPSVSNGVIIATGTNNYFDNGPALADSPFGEVLLLDAATGKLLRELPLGKLNQPSTNPPIYNRSIAVGKRLFISTGRFAFVNGVDPTGPYNKVIMYHLSSDKNKDCDDRDDDLIHKDNN